MNIKKELKLLGMFLLVLFAFFQIHYYKENVFTILRLLMAHFILFILPGYCLCLYFYDKFNFIERMILALGVGYGLQPFIVYLINFLSKTVITKYNIYVSIVLLTIGILINIRGFKNGN